MQTQIQFWIINIVVSRIDRWLQSLIQFFDGLDFEINQIVINAYGFRFVKLVTREKHYSDSVFRIVGDRRVDDKTQIISVAEWALK